MFSTYMYIRIYYLESKIQGEQYLLRSIIAGYYNAFIASG
jgi:hypothetical protein